MSADVPGMIPENADLRVYGQINVWLSQSWEKNIKSNNEEPYTDWHVSTSMTLAPGKWGHGMVWEL